ncbi:uncharacterized protein LOC110726158 [Chenopodium quinoa]|uniref:uncharacterized protein LOC110726158 n=1 Tax=Chenopodium quinoa TaxID=63459 RepID=UPI000B778964|nr:uncharacterized protein LOC110726158 [Chenopodium quinoa]
MSPLEVNWMPFGQNPSNRVPRTLYTGLIQYREIVEAYMPQRCLRQLGFVQVVPPPPAWPSKAVRSASSKEYVVQWPSNMISMWEQFSMVARLWTAELQRPPSGVTAMCDQHYMEWYIRHSHPRLIKDIDDADDDDVPPATASYAWMGKIMQLGHRLFEERDCMTSASGRAVIDDLERTLEQWQWASQRDY